LDGAELTRAAAVAGARANIWREDKLPTYLERLERARFSGEWLSSFRAGKLPGSRLEDGERRLTALAVPILLRRAFHGHGPSYSTKPVTWPTSTSRSGG
jgi:hypothetical protein